MLPCRGLFVNKAKPSNLCGCPVLSGCGKLAAEPLGRVDCEVGSPVDALSVFSVVG